MKTEFVKYGSKGNIRGILTVLDKKMDIYNKFIFKPELMYMWYPLDMNYNVTYRVSTGELGLSQAVRNVPYKDYGLTKYGDTYYTKVKGVWEFAEVRKSNEQIAQLMKDSLLPTWTDPNYNYDNVTRALRSVGDSIFLLTNERKAEYMSNLSATELYKYYTYSEEEKERLAYAMLTKEEKRRYITLGEMLTMLHIMKKVIRARYGYKRISR